MLSPTRNGPGRPNVALTLAIVFVVLVLLILLVFWRSARWLEEPSPGVGGYTTQLMDPVNAESGGSI